MTAEPGYDVNNHSTHKCKNCGQWIYNADGTWRHTFTIKAECEPGLLSAPADIP